MTTTTGNRPLNVDPFKGIPKPCSCPFQEDLDNTSTTRGFDFDDSSLSSFNASSNGSWQMGSKEQHKTSSTVVALGTNNPRCKKTKGKMTKMVVAENRKKTDQQGIVHQDDEFLQVDDWTGFDGDDICFTALSVRRSLSDGAMNTLIQNQDILKETSSSSQARGRGRGRSKERGRSSSAELEFGFESQKGIGRGRSRSRGRRASTKSGQVGKDFEERKRARSVCRDHKKFNDSANANLERNLERLQSSSKSRGKSKSRGHKIKDARIVQSEQIGTSSQHEQQAPSSQMNIDSKLGKQLENLPQNSKKGRARSRGRRNNDSRSVQSEQIGESAPSSRRKLHDSSNSKLGQQLEGLPSNPDRARSRSRGRRNRDARSVQSELVGTTAPSSRRKLHDSSSSNFGSNLEGQPPTPRGRGRSLSRARKKSSDELEQSAPTFEDRRRARSQSRSRRNFNDSANSNLERNLERINCKQRDKSKDRRRRNSLGASSEHQRRVPISTDKPHSSHVLVGGSKSMDQKAHETATEGSISKPLPSSKSDDELQKISKSKKERKNKKREKRPKDGRNTRGVSPKASKAASDAQLLPGVESKSLNLRKPLKARSLSPKSYVTTTKQRENKVQESKDRRTNILDSLMSALEGEEPF